MSFQVKIRRKCQDCKGTGRISEPQRVERDCWTCEGTGWVEAWADAETRYRALGDRYYTLMVKL